MSNRLTWREEPVEQYFPGRKSVGDQRDGGPHSRRDCLCERFAGGCAGVQKRRQGGDNHHGCLSAADGKVPRDIPELFKYNAFVVICDGVNNKYGSLFAPYDP